jgi:hypothetical protein
MRVPPPAQGSLCNLCKPPLQSPAASVMFEPSARRWFAPTQPRKHDLSASSRARGHPGDPPCCPHSQTRSQGHLLPNSLVGTQPPAVRGAATERLTLCGVSAQCAHPFIHHTPHIHSVEISQISTNCSHLCTSRQQWRLLAAPAMPRTYMGSSRGCRCTWWRGAWMVVCAVA